MYDIQQECQYGYEDEHAKYNKYSGCEKEIDYPEEPKYRNRRQYIFSDYDNKDIGTEIKIEINNINIDTKKIIESNLNEYYKNFFERRSIYDLNKKKEKASIYIQKIWRGYIYRKQIINEYDKYLYN